jgi:hypothetical protein
MRTLANIVEEMQYAGNRLRYMDYFGDEDCMDGDCDGDLTEDYEAEHDKLWQEFKDLLGLPVNMGEGFGRLDLAIAEIIGNSLRMKELERRLDLTEDELCHYAGYEKSEEELGKITDHMEAQFI